MILIIGHDASLTGAPKFLLHFSQWLRSEKNEKLLIVLRNGGPLINEYKKVAPVFIWNTPYVSSPFSIRLRNKITNFYSRRKKRFLKKIKNLPIDFIFCNTVTNGEILKALAFLNKPVLLRVPELENVYNLFNKEGNADESLRISNHIIAVSQAVKDNLIKNHQIPFEKISVIHGFIPKINNTEKKNISNNFVIGGCGTLILRKGFDLFLQIANIVVNKRGLKDAQFLWIGGDKTSYTFSEFQQEIEILGLRKNITITGETDNPFQHYEKMNIFLMTSREDPFPLVNLEAAQYGLPIICFDRSGGSPEFVTEDVGFVVPYLDVEAMAEKVIELKNNKEERETMSTCIKTKSEQFTVEKKAPELYEIFTMIMEKTIEV